MNISFYQHNIGSIEHKFKNNIYDTTGFQSKSNIITHKKYKHTVNRDFVSYMITNRNNNDIVCLQEVQNGNKNFNTIIDLFENRYFVDYINTGSLFYTDENENPYGLIENPIHHGCLVAINLNKFQIIEVIKNNESQRNKTSNWIIFKEIKTGKMMACISIHGEILNPMNQKVLDRYKIFYGNLIKNIELIRDKYEEISFIISGDFNINIIKPNFNPFNTISSEKTDKWSPMFFQVLKQFYDFCISNHIFSAPYNNPTNLSIKQNFIEKLDFIFLSKDLFWENFELLNYHELLYYESGESEEPELIVENYLYNDFDHSSIFTNINI